jgi:polyhydroxyalkanoate synthesis regulator phasin
MNPIHIFRAGQHTSSGGSTLDFTEDTLKAVAQSYDPQLMQAPIVVGHPTDNGPAFGWISGIEFSEKGLHAVPDQINADFAEMVSKGSYKKVSASFYGPDAASNPTPGQYYLRHVGFLGAMPPAIKGLEAIQFNEADDYVEFSLDNEGDEPGDKLMERLLAKVATVFDLTPQKTKPANFVETLTGEGEMTPEEIKAASDKLEADQKTHDNAVAEFSEKQKAALALATQAHNAALGARVDALVEAGTILPAQAASLKSFAEGIDRESVVEFGEGEDIKKESAVEFLFGLLASKKEGPDFSERSRDDQDPANAHLTDGDVARKAQDYRTAQKVAGREVSFTEAVQAVSK